MVSMTVTDIDPESLRIQERIESFGRLLQNQQEGLNALLMQNKALEDELNEFLQHELREAYDKGFRRGYNQCAEAFNLNVSIVPEP